VAQVVCRAIQPGVCSLENNPRLVRRFNESAGYSAKVKDNNPMTSQKPCAVAASVALLLASMAPSASAQAQTRGAMSATVTAAAPVYLLPDASRTPLRTLPAGAVVVITQTQGDWFQVSFEDAQYGRRTGWIQRKFVSTPTPMQGPPPELPPPGTKGQPRPPVKGGKPIVRRSNAPAYRVFVSYSMDKAASPKSFDAITGSDRVQWFGGGVQGLRLWHDLFVEGSVEHNTSTGERVFVFNDQVFPLGIPLKLSMTPVDMVAGWRLPLSRTRPRPGVPPSRVGIERLAAYAGGGATLLKYKETSDFADADENIDKWYPGLVVFGGAEVTVARSVHVRGEVRYRQVNDVLGAGGVSKQFGETKFGGVGVQIKVAFGQ